MIEARQTDDLRAFETAYRLRGGEIGRRTFQWVPVLWFKSMTLVKISAAVWGVGFLLHLPIVWGTGVLGMALFGFLHWHVLRIPRLTIVVGLICVGMLAVGIVTHVFCTRWVCPG